MKKYSLGLINHLIELNILAQVCYVLASGFWVTWFVVVVDVVV